MDKNEDFNKELDAKFDALEKTQKEISDAIENGATKETVEKLTNAMKEQGDLIEALELKLSQREKSEMTMADSLKENMDEIKEAAKHQISKEIVIKADTVRASVVGNQQAHELSSIGQLGHVKLSAFDIFRKIPISESNNNGVIRYYDWDEATTVRAAATVAEGVAFAESTAKWATYTLPIQKIGDTLPVSAEFYEDEAMFAAELEMFLDTNVRIERENQIVLGDGTGTNLTGIFTAAPVYTPVASGITDASIYDLIPVLSANITETRGSKYSPNFALMNINDILDMKLKKDANNNYVMPPFVDASGQRVDGILVLENNTVVANTMVIGDSRYARIYNKTGITLSRGFVNAQFVEDMETLKVRERLAFLIRNVDKTGFLRVTSISAALTTLATP
jgi:HK97 family phage major capsid protein